MSRASQGKGKITSVYKLLFLYSLRKQYKYFLYAKLNVKLKLFFCVVCFVVGPKKNDEKEKKKNKKFVLINVYEVQL